MNIGDRLGKQLVFVVMTYSATCCLKSYRSLQKQKKIGAISYNDIIMKGQLQNLQNATWAVNDISVLYLTVRQQDAFWIQSMQVRPTSAIFQCYPTDSDGRNSDLS